MSVYKEGFYWAEAISKASKRIYPDACDYGALTKKDDAIWNTAKALVDLFGVALTRKEYRYSTGRSVEHTIQLMNEWDTGDIIQFKITFVSCNDIKGYDGYIYCYFDNSNGITWKGRPFLQPNM